MMGDLIRCLPTRLFILGLEEAADLCAPGPHLFQTLCEEAGGRRAGWEDGEEWAGSSSSHQETRRIALLRGRDELGPFSGF